MKLFFARPDNDGALQARKGAPDYIQARGAKDNFLVIQKLSTKRIHHVLNPINPTSLRLTKRSKPLRRDLDLSLDKHVHTNS